MIPPAKSEQKVPSSWLRSKPSYLELGQESSGRPGRAFGEPAEHAVKRNCPKLGTGKLTTGDSLGRPKPHTNPTRQGVHKGTRLFP